MRTIHQTIALAAISLFAAQQTGAQTVSRLDSTNVEQLQEIVVKGVRAQKNAPFAQTNIKKKELQEHSTTGRELPFLLSRTPGVLATSENGLGTGTSHLSIRGATDSRINVTLDGVALNSPEDQCVFWANMNSYGSLLGSVQIQRGVGTSTNGDGAFGGTLSLSSAAPQQTPGAELSTSFGSFNTSNIGGRFSTGLLFDHLIFDGAYHETNTDGFIHGTDGRSGSYYGGLSWLQDNLQIRYKHIGNFETTGQAWNGVTSGNGDFSVLDGMSDGNTGITTYEDMWKAGLGRYNDLYEDLVVDENWQLVKQGGKYQTQRLTTTGNQPWRHTTDRFWQHHNLLTGAMQINDNLSATATIHYTHGWGFYRQLRIDNNLAKKFGIDFYDAQGNYVKKSDVIRKKGLTQDVYGAVANINYTNDRWDIIGGLSGQQFKGNHYGYLTYFSKDIVAASLLKDGNYKYYDSDAEKLDANIFAKATYKFTPELQAYADLQYRHVYYMTDGVNDVFVKQADGTYTNNLLNIDATYNFVNPKLGISYSKDNHMAYASVAMSNREPERNNFTDNGSYPAPKAEHLTDIELGYTYTSQPFSGGLNLYYMKYDDQFVKTGEVSDIGEALTTNIKDSYRMGVELWATANILPWLTLEGNAALSQNKIKDFDEHVETYDDYWGDMPTTIVHYSSSTLAFSPSTILNGFIDLHHKQWRATWHTNYVSRQYLDNTENKLRSLPSFSASDIHLSFSSKVTKVEPLKEVIFTLGMENVFNKHYATSGWVYSAILGNSYPENNRYYQIGFMPMATRTVTGTMTLRF